MQRAKFDQLVRQFPFLPEISTRVRESKHAEITNIEVKRMDRHLMETRGVRYHHPRDGHSLFTLVFKDPTLRLLPVAPDMETPPLETLDMGPDDPNLFCKDGERVGPVIISELFGVTGRSFFCPAEDDPAYDMTLKQLSAVVEETVREDILDGHQYFLTVYLPPRDWTEIVAYMRWAFCRMPRFRVEGIGV